MNDRSLIFLVVGIGVLGWLILQQKQTAKTSAPASTQANPNGGSQANALQGTFDLLLGLGKSVVDAFSHGSSAETNTQRA